MFVGDFNSKLKSFGCAKRNTSGPMLKNIQNQLNLIYVNNDEHAHMNRANSSVPTHMVTLTQVGTSVYLGQTHLRTPVQVPAWVRKFSLGSTGDEISPLIIICTAEVCILNSPFVSFW